MWKGLFDAIRDATGVDLPVAVVVGLPGLGALIYRRYSNHMEILKLGSGPAWDRLLVSVSAEKTWRQIYTAWMKSLTANMDGAIGKAALGGSSYDYAFTLAFVAPILSMFLFWVAVGEDTSGLGLFLPDPAGAIERIALGITVLTWVMFVLSLRKSNPPPLAPTRLALYAGAFLYLAVFMSSGHVPVALLVIVIAYFSHPQVAPALAFMLMAGFLSGFFAATVAGLWGGVVVLLLVSMFTRTTMRNRMHAQRFWGARAMQYYDQLTILLWLMTATAVISTFPPANDQILFYRSIAAWLVVLGVVPALTTPFLWGSVELSRSLLRRDIPASGLFLSLLAGAALALGVMLALVVGVQLFNFAVGNSGAGPIIDLAGFLQTARLHSGNHGLWWVYVVLTLTLVPTLLYCIVIVGAIIAAEAPTSLRYWALDKLTAPGFDRDPIAQKQVALFLTARSCVGVAVGCLLMSALVYLIVTYTPRFGQLSLCACELTAGLLGASVSGTDSCSF